MAFSLDMRSGPALVDPWLVCKSQFAQGIDLAARPGRKTWCPDPEAHVLAAAAPTIVEQILGSAARAAASDVHFELRDRMVVRVRKDGALKPVFGAPRPLGQFIMGRLKALAELPLCPGARPEGRFSMRVGSNTIAMRLSFAGLADGEKAVVRLLNTCAHPALRLLGFTEEDLGRYDLLIRSPGLVLIAGPAGSGKTTTLYASLMRLARPETNVVSLEDPVEMILPVVQISVDHRRETFESCLASVMRQDPDVIAIGEIRDHDSAVTAVRAALTGRTALASIHAQDTIGAAYRLADLGLPMSLISAAISGAVSQRLVRKICRTCLGTGCDECDHTGYNGRIGVFEVVSFPPWLLQAIANGASLEAARTMCWRLDQHCIQRPGERKACAGMVTTTEMMEVFAEGGGGK